MLYPVASLRLASSAIAFAAVPGPPNAASHVGRLRVRSTNGSPLMATSLAPGDPDEKIVPALRLLYPLPSVPVRAFQTAL